MKYKYIRVREASQERLVEIDVKYVPGKIAGRRYYQYTAIDVASRWRHLEIYDEQTNHTIQYDFLQGGYESDSHTPLQAIKTDNHATFTQSILYWQLHKRRRSFGHDRCTLLISSVLHTTSYTISLIRVNPLKMVLLKEVTVKIRRSSMNKTDSKISMIWKESSKYGILTTTI